MVQHQQQHFGDDMNHNFCREADPKDPRPWCYTTHPFVKYDYCDCSGGSISTKEVCGTVNKEISFDFDRYDSQASVIPEINDPSYEGDRIIGGVDANPGEVPWQVNLLLYGDSVKCGGTLVSSTVTFSVPAAMVLFQFFAKIISENYISSALFQKTCMGRRMDCYCRSYTSLFFNKSCKTFEKLTSSSVSQCYSYQMASKLQKTFSCVFKIV